MQANGHGDMQRRRQGEISRSGAFTLIELLIVVAIIAILAAIAAPNFLEAQTRSKVARVIADHRSIATACESYFIDHNTYPTEPSTGRLFLEYVHPLSTPVAYLTSLALRDPFMPAQPAWLPADPGFQNSYNYLTYHGPWGTSNIDWHPKCYIVVSFGPDMEANKDNLHSGGWIPYYWCYLKDHEYACNMIYDPTNGTRSGGNIIRCGGALPGVDIVIGG